MKVNLKDLHKTEKPSMDFYVVSLVLCRKMSPLINRLHVKQSGIMLILVLIH